MNNFDKLDSISLFRYIKEVDNVISSDFCDNMLIDMKCSEKKWLIDNDSKLMDGICVKISYDKVEPVWKKYMKVVHNSVKRIIQEVISDVNSSISLFDNRIVNEYKYDEYDREKIYFDGSRLLLFDMYIIRYLSVDNRLKYEYSNKSISGSCVKKSFFDVVYNSCKTTIDSVCDNGELNIRDRLFCYIIFLNDMCENGGENGGEIDIYGYGRVIPKKGKMLIYPCCWSVIVRNNINYIDKYIIRGYIESKGLIY